MYFALSVMCSDLLRPRAIDYDERMFVEGDVEIKIKDRMAQGLDDHELKLWIQRSFKDMACYQSWSQLLASNGLVAVTYEAENPALDAQAVLSYLHTDATNLGIDVDRIGLWSCSGNSPTAVSLLAQSDLKIRCLASLYGYLMDVGDSTAVADAAAQFGFANPTADIELDSIKDKPTLLVRAGRDQMPGLNDAADRFVSLALQENLPLGLLNYPEGDHAFDLTDQSSRSLAAIQQVVDFLVRQLNVQE